ncbi:hypothetical protein [Spirosoma oryzicola]|uniref:hypothetical protein n=1 Tax=Spirosoma oryzicola TaxID=2898794 RepID=UPI001E30F67B|nr:hypothetical protein [Spirosoma oryzicola]UHG91518.1 hypothetical protein LQ777_01145 [Spirosoma oryzicola]
MHYLLSLAVFILLMSSCRRDDDPVATNLKSSIGTYEVTRLTQYVNGQKTFDGYLPFLMPDSTTITHRIGISMANPQPDGTVKASILRNVYRKGARGFLVNKIANIGGLNIIAKRANQTNDIVGFYRDGASAFGYYGPQTQNLAFDIVEPDSLNQLVRYVFEAKKVSATANRF